MKKAKFILVGKGKVGKTSLLTQFDQSVFYTEYQMTTAPDKVIKKLKIKGEEITLDIWDTAGQEVFAQSNKLFMKKTNIALIVYDITNRDSFKELNEWHQKVCDCVKGENVIFGIAANKSDLFEKKEVQVNEGKEFANKINALFFETSARDNESVKKAFEGLTEAYLNKLKEDNEQTKEEKQEENIIIDENTQKQKNLENAQKKSCCGGKKNVKNNKQNIQNENNDKIENNH